MTYKTEGPLPPVAERLEVRGIAQAKARPMDTIVTEIKLMLMPHSWLSVKRARVISAEPTGKQKMAPSDALKSAPDMRRKRNQPVQQHRAMNKKKWIT